MSGGHTLDKASLFEAIHTESVAGQWCCLETDLHFVTAQVEAPSLQLMAADQSRPTSVNTLRGLLAQPTQNLAQIVPHGSPAVLSLPELALGSCDWNAVDGFVRSYPSPIILISGFGITEGEWLTQWRNVVGSTTERRFGWPASWNPAIGRRYNGGWCWIHIPGKTVCICFLKNFAEQTAELPEFDRLDTGQHTLCIETDDVTLFPVICADLLWRSPTGEYVVHKRIAASLEARGSKEKKALVLGLLYQPKHHGLWRTAIESLAFNVAPAVLNVALTNCGFDLASRAEPDDRWRNFSGVYVTRHRAKHCSSFNAARGFQTDGTSGAVARDTGPCAAGGPMRWQFGVDQGDHIWAVKMDYALGADGLPAASRCNSKSKYELKRFLKRFGKFPTAANSQLLGAALNVVEQQLDANAIPEAEHLSTSVLQGSSLPAAKESIPDPEMYHDVWEALLQGVACLGALRMQPYTEWQTDLSVPGQMVATTLGIRLLVWRSPTLRVSAMRQIIYRWAGERRSAQPLLAYVHGVNVGVAETKEISRRADYAAPPRASKGDITEPAIQTTVTIESLSDFDSSFEVTDSNAFLAAIESLVKKSAGKLRPAREGIVT